MSSVRSRHDFRLIAACVIGAAAALSGLGPAPAAAEDVLTAVTGAGLSVTRAECSAMAEAVWVTAMGRNFCMRYYLSTAGGDGPRPVVFLQGDWAGPPKSETTDSLAMFAERLSTLTNAPAIYLARVGRDGSSGSHDMRHSLLELTATNAAMDAIKRRYHYEGFHVEGHSGGGTLTGGLLGLRNDIACAVPADGVLDSPLRKAPDRTLDNFNVADQIPAIARKSATRILVVTDPQDKVVTIEHQLPFVEKLRKIGGRVEVFYVDSGGDEHSDHHFTTPHADLVMRDCIRGASYDQIAADLAGLVAARLKARLAALKAKAANSVLVP